MRILDLTRWWAGPFTTTWLADLGAEVVKVEAPEGGDKNRLLTPQVNGESYYFLMLNRNKKSITLNLWCQKGKDIFLRLLEKQDVVFNNYAPGTMEKMGLGYEELRKINPRVIYATTSGFGQTGPYRERRSYDQIAQAMGGLMSINGDPEGLPTLAADYPGDLVTPLYQAIAILAAVHYREKTGRGQSLDISQLDCLCANTSVLAWSEYFATGQNPRRWGNQDPGGSPGNMYKAKDGYIYLTVVADEEWKRFAECIGRKELLEDPRFATVNKRQEHPRELDAITQEWVKERTVAEADAELAKAHLAVAPVLTTEQVVNNPHVLARGMVIEQEHPIAGKIRIVGSVFKSSETPGQVRSPAPLLGQHNEEVYSSLLGFGKEELAQLKEERVI